MKLNFKTIIGLSLIFMAIFMMRDSTYIFIKSFLVANGSSIWFAVLFTWSLIGTSFLCGVVLIKIVLSNKNSHIAFLNG
tara:strand:- start:340 stop:576 length:237 start_codon:yes stop_codon:yes gene_type:complete